MAALPHHERTAQRTLNDLREESGEQWTEVLLKHPAHEGMEAGDLDLDGEADLILNHCHPNHLRGSRPASVTLVTTLLDPKRYPAEDLARLYARRWRIELWFRDIKTALGMEVLRCQSPKMVHKELEMFLIAYNLIGALAVQASASSEVPLDRISFKGTVDASRQYSLAIAQARSKKKQRELVADLLRVIALDPVPDRPGRREPRAVKRRPKPFPLLNQPRRQCKEIPHRNRCWKNDPRKTRA